MAYEDSDQLPQSDLNLRCPCEESVDRLLKNGQIHRGAHAHFLMGRLIKVKKNYKPLGTQDSVFQVPSSWQIILPVEIGEWPGLQTTGAERVVSALLKSTYPFSIWCLLPQSVKCNIWCSIKGGNYRFNGDNLYLEIFRRIVLKQN